jgi:hypothetical protein
MNRTFADRQRQTVRRLRVAFCTETETVRPPFRSRRTSWSFRLYAGRRGLPARVRKGGSWRDQLSGAFTALALDHPVRIRVHTLDRFYKSVTFVQGDKYGPPMLPKIVNVADRIVAPLPKALNIYGSEMERT